MNKRGCGGLLGATRGDQDHELAAVPGMSRIEPLQRLAVLLVFKEALHEEASVVPQTSRILARGHSFTALKTDLGPHPQAQLSGRIDLRGELDAQTAGGAGPGPKTDRPADS